MPEYQIRVRPTAEQMERPDASIRRPVRTERLARRIARDRSVDEHVPFYAAVYDNSPDPGGQAYPVAVYRKGRELTGAALEVALTTPFGAHAARPMPDVALSGAQAIELLAVHPTALDVVRDAEAAAWNAALATGDQELIDRTREAVLGGIHARIMTEDEYQARTTGAGTGVNPIQGRRAS